MLPSTIKTDHHNITEILLKVALKTNTLTPRNIYMGKILRKIVIEMLILLKRQHDKVWYNGILIEHVLVTNPILIVVGSH